MLIVRFATAGGNGEHDFLAFERMPGRAVRPAVFEHLVLPQLEQRGGAVPVEGELQDDSVRVLDETLFGGDVDATVGVRGVLVADGHVMIGVVEHGLREFLVDARSLKIRVEQKDGGFHMIPSSCRIADAVIGDCTPGDATFRRLMTYRCQARCLPGLNRYCRLMCSDATNRQPPQYCCRPGRAQTPRNTPDGTRAVPGLRCRFHRLPAPHHKTP